MNVKAIDICASAGYRQFVGGRTTFRIYNGPVSEPKEPGEITLSTVRDKSIRVREPYTPNDDVDLLTRLDLGPLLC